VKPVISADDPVPQVEGVAPLELPDQLELGAVVLGEQPPPAAEQDRYEMDLELVEQAVSEQRPGPGPGAVHQHGPVAGRSSASATHAATSV
jgi:hypothetical protein